MVYLLKMVIFHGYVTNNQRLHPNSSWPWPWPTPLSTCDGSEARCEEWDQPWWRHRTWATGGVVNGDIWGSKPILLWWMLKKNMPTHDSFNRFITKLASHQNRRMTLHTYKHLPQVSPHMDQQDTIILNTTGTQHYIDTGSLAKQII